MRDAITDKDSTEENNNDNINTESGASTQRLRKFSARLKWSHDELKAMKKFVVKGVMSNSNLVQLRAMQPSLEERTDEQIRARFSYLKNKGR
jgi:hypothetical protein